MWVTAEKVKIKQRAETCGSPNSWADENQEKGERYVGHFWADENQEKCGKIMWVTPEQVENQEKGGKHVVPPQQAEIKKRRET